MYVPAWKSSKKTEHLAGGGGEGGVWRAGGGRVMETGNSLHGNVTP